MHLDMFIRIEPAINYSQPTGFSNNKNITINGWKSTLKYRVGILRGVLYPTEGTDDMSNITSVSTIEQLALLQNSGRIDLFITDKDNGNMTLKKMKLDKEIKALSPPLIEKIHLYHYIHKNHKELVPEVEKIVQEMTRSGEFETLRKKYLYELIHNAK
jgi:polar amino acid transport system substrate-binding protein